MLEEYLCLGGTEIANNARTYGYATTSGCPMSWFRCEPCETLRYATGDWIPPTYRTVELGRNLFPNPSFEGDGSLPPGAEFSTEWWVQGGVDPLPVEDEFSSAFSTGFDRGLEGTGRSLYVPLGYVTIATLTDQTFSIVPRSAGQIVRFDGVDHPAVAPESPVRFYGSGVVELGVGWWDHLLIATGEYRGPYFDGDTADPTDDDEIFWTGEPNASESVWEQEQVETPGHTLNPEYTNGNITDAPWYDADVPASTRFYGVYVITIENLNSSTRTASVTEGILDGGVVGLVRNATREVRTRALLVAEGDDALEYGLAWLTAALTTEDCSTHGSTCGAADLSFFAYCPEAPDPQAPPDNGGSDTWDMDLYAPRFLHGVTVTSGPLVEQYLKSSNGRHVGYIVEWTMVAATPWVFGTTNEINVSPSAPVIVQDLPFNLMPYPSAELSAGTVVVQTNYSANPSVETNATGWNAGQNVILPVPTGARSTEIAADGVASYKVSLTATNSGTNGSLWAYQDVTLPAEVSGQRFSVTEWGAAFVVGGTAVLGGMRLVLEWRTGSTLVSAVTIGTGVASGGAISMVGMTRPATATIARVIMYADVTSWSTGAVLNLFADALALTSP